MVRVDRLRFVFEFFDLFAALDFVAVLRVRDLPHVCWPT